MTTAAETKRLSSSLRARTAEESLSIVPQLARARGVSRVVDTTWLDRIGIPVFASIRPDAQSLCVNAGKGFTPAEAKIGAYMEAIEFSFAEEGRNAVPWRLVKPGDILDSFQARIAFTEFCAQLDKEVHDDDDIAVCRADEILSQLGEVLVPAELVYAPFEANPGVRLYGCSTNGLASGNNLIEATVHGLAEVMERDVHAFQIIGDKSVLVGREELTPKLLEMFERIEVAGLSCYLRYVPNRFGMAFFSAYVLEPDELNPIAIAGGHGFHPVREIAAVRALAEAVQSRLTNIHGGRDDLMRHVKLEGDLGVEAMRAAVRERQAQVADATGVVNFSSIPDVDVPSIDAALECLYGALRKEGLVHVARVVLTEPDYPFQVVRIIVPGAESFTHGSQRVGPRLLEAFSTHE
ncbi:ribosomal protein S12 methylthiotransferase accessory factor [Roseateles asaccharophilus]|uniref:YcaO-like family protein n=1 Tax=Roseateles asaccharophilus TaxID=582607 RepID=UPI0038380F9A